MLMRAATVVQVLQDLFYVLLLVLFYLRSLLNVRFLFVQIYPYQQLRLTNRTLPAGVDKNYLEVRLYEL